MKNLLKPQENRRLEFVKKLSTLEDWMILSDLASYLDCSSRVLKEDISHLNTHSKSLKIETSTLGARVKFNKNQHLNSFCQEVLAQSTAYQLLEAIFLNENKTISDLAEILFVSSTTLYRMINQLNLILKEEYGFHIETNPCRFEGAEEKIRYFFFRYFFEKYPRFNFPFEGIAEYALDKFLTSLLKFSPIPIDFAFYNVTKTILMVNLTRYKNKGYIEIDEENRRTPKLSSSLTENYRLLGQFGSRIRLKTDKGFVTQVFTQYIQKGLFFAPEQLLEEADKNPEFSNQVNFLRQTLENIAVKNNLELNNKEFLVFGLFNTVFLEYQEPQSGHILYNRNKYFADDIAQEFPRFYADLYDGMKKFRKVLNKPITEDGIAFYIYTVFSNWANIVPQLRKKIKKIKTLVISDRNQTHAEMIKNFIEYEFSEQITIDFFTEIELNPTGVKQMTTKSFNNSTYRVSDLKVVPIFTPNH